MARLIGILLVTLTVIAASPIRPVYAQSDAEGFEVGGRLIYRSGRCRDGARPPSTLSFLFRVAVQNRTAVATFPMYGSTGRVVRGAKGGQTLPLQAVYKYRSGGTETNTLVLEDWNRRTLRATWRVVAKGFEEEEENCTLLYSGTLRKK